MTDAANSGANRSPFKGRRYFQDYSLVAITVASCVLITLIWLGVSDAIRMHRTETLARLEARVSSTALAIAAQVRFNLYTIDQTLRVVQTAAEDSPQKFRLTRPGSPLAVSAESALPLFLTDGNGVVRDSTRSGLVGRTVTSPQELQRARVLSPTAEAIVLDMRLHTPADRFGEIALARPVFDAQGRFAGLIAASCNPQRLVQLPTTVDVTPPSLVALIDLRSGAVQPLTHGDDTVSVENISGSSLFEAMQNAEDGIWTGLSPFNDGERMRAFRRVAGRDLAVVVTADSAAMLRQSRSWDRAAQGFGAAFTVLVLLLAALLGQSIRAGRRREAALASDRAMLAEKTRQLEATLAGMSDGIMMVDADLRLLAWNDRFSDFTGVPRDLLQVGRPMQDMLRAQARAGEFGPVNVEAEVARRIELMLGTNTVGMLTRQRPNGQTIELRRNPLSGGGFVTLYSDVTARHAAEAGMRDAQKMAAVGRLTAGVAHDFNNVLASIIGSAELLERRLRGDPAHRTRIAVILHAAQRGADLVRQLLAFSRRQPLDPVAVELNNVVRGMSDLLRTTLGGVVKVETRLGARWPAWADPVQIEHVILNLAINARDAMPDGGTLTVASADVMLEQPLHAAGLAPGAYVAVSVSDTGTGMTPAVQQQALEPFFTTKPPGRGSGLGLSQVYGVARQSGGGVRIDSTVGRGTTVTVYLPRASAASPGIETQPARSGALPRFQGTVLLVEDDPNVRETVAGMLAAIGFTPLVAEDGAAALHLMDSGQCFDLLLSDLVMPGMNGVQLAEAVRSRCPAMPVVLVTGYADDLRVSGERWVLTKPFVTSRLAETLRAALRQRRQTEVPEQADS